MELTGRLYDKEIGRATLKILFDQLNDKIDEMEPTWDEEDEDFWLSINRGMPNWSMESVPETNFHEGADPGLINAPIHYYPSVYVFCHMGAPTNSSDDTGELYSFTLDIELMAKSGSFTEDFNLDLANQASMRLNRLQEAVSLVMLKNRTLGGIITDINAPAMTKGEVFVRREDRGKNPKFYWQGGVLRYTVYKWVKML